MPIPKDKPAPDLITVKQASELLKCSDQTLLRFRKEGKLHTYRIRSRVFLNRTEVLCLLEPEVLR